MHSHRPLTDPRLIAAAALRHPAALALPSTAADALVALSDRDTPYVSPAEMRLLTATLALLVAAEIGREARP